MTVKWRIRSRTIIPWQSLKSTCFYLTKSPVCFRPSKNKSALSPTHSFDDSVTSLLNTNSFHFSQVKIFWNSWKNIFPGLSILRKVLTQIGSLSSAKSSVIIMFRSSSTLISMIYFMQNLWTVRSTSSSSSSFDHKIFITFPFFMLFGNQYSNNLSSMGRKREKMIQWI